MNWKDINGYEGFYQVSSCGNIRSLKYYGKKRKEPKILKASASKGYRVIGLRKDGNKKTFKVSRIVGFAFLNDYFCGAQINHINGIKDDDRLCNLEWVTPQENIKHAFDNKLNSNNGEMHSQNKLCKNDVLQIRSVYDQFKFNQAEIAKAYGVTQTLISKIVNNKSWSHL